LMTSMETSKPNQDQD